MDDQKKTPVQNNDKAGNKSNTSKNVQFTQTTSDAQPGYGTTSSSAPSDARKLRRAQSIIYCVHGKVASDCCDVDQLQIKTVKPDDAHCHRLYSPRSEGIDKDARRKLVYASILCVVFMIAEIVGGILSNSLAIATDAAHLLADFASFMISLMAIYIASRRSTKRMSYGFHRAEVIGALISVLLIWVVTAILVYLAVLRCIEPAFKIDTKFMLIGSIIGIVVNVIMGCVLHDHGHAHGGSHGHSHAGKHEDHEAVESGGLNESSHQHKHQNMNVRAALIHVISDFVQSCGVFLAALIIFFKPNWVIIDPICTFMFSLLVLYTTINIMKDAILVLMEATPAYLDYTEIMETFLSIDGIVRVHNLRVWCLSVSKVAIAAHLAVLPNANPETILREATKKIHAKYDFYETTLQIEVYDDEMEACKDCTNPE